MTVALHEAAHATAAIMLGRHVEHVERNPGLTLVGEELGHCLAPIDGEIEVSQVALCLIGYMAEDRDGWPPPYEQARTEKLESLGVVLGALGVTPEAYEASVELVRDMLVDPDFTRLRDAIARALGAAPRLEAEDLEALRAIHLPDTKEDDLT
jgi:hypothetical protein